MVAQLVKNPPAIQETPVHFLGQKDPWEKGQLPTPALLGFLVAQMVKDPPAMRETWVQSLGWEDPLEEGLAIPLQYFCLENSWTEEPGGLQSMGSQRI